ncbi:MAG: hypothetical protein UMV23_03315 [Halanaerobium sp.]|nr:hypothetical protein [Halanaerobium sp.]
MKNYFCCLLIVILFLLLTPFVFADSAIYDEVYFELGIADQVQGEVYYVEEALNLENTSLEEKKILESGSSIRGFMDSEGYIYGVTFSTEENSGLKFTLTPQYKYGEGYHNTITIENNSLLFLGIQTDEIPPEWKASWEESGFTYQLELASGKLICDLDEGLMQHGGLEVSPVPLYNPPAKVIPEPGQKVKFQVEYIQDVNLDLDNYVLTKEIIACSLQPMFGVKSIAEIEDDMDKKLAQKAISQLKFMLKQEKQGKVLHKFIISVEQGSVELNINRDKIFLYYMLEQFQFQGTTDVEINETMIVSEGERMELIFAYDED